MTQNRRKENRWTADGDVATIWLDRKDGTVLACLIDSADLELALGVGSKWGARWSADAKTFYVATRGNLLIHRLITNAPKGYEVDHANHSALDNRRCNLKVCTPSENSLNRRPRVSAKATSSTPYKGIYGKSDGTYRAQVSVNGRRRDLPRTFQSAEQANQSLAVFESEVALLIESFSARAGDDPQERR